MSKYLTNFWQDFISRCAAGADLPINTNEAYFLTAVCIVNATLLGYAIYTLSGL